MWMTGEVYRLLKVQKAAITAGDVENSNDKHGIAVASERLRERPFQ